jgi:hypothetical protein
MKIVRDNEMNGILMIPLWQQYQLHRCNVAYCKERQTTIVIDLVSVPFAICEKHYKEFSESGKIECTLHFDQKGVWPHQPIKQDI